ncbi:MAG TPA: sigma 54-interacting transcriptional regulator [Vicinamibacterales bacterium]|nr:sigma 54-interacting transcriptional regulator [Vicinamibacterales bacterium]
MSAAMKPVDGVDPASDLQVLKQAIASAPSGIVVCSKFGRVLLANQSITALFGYTPGELSDRDFRTIVPDLTTAAGGTAQDVTGICKDGSIVPVRISVSNVPAHDSLYVASVVDLSQQRNLEERLSAAVSHSRFQTMVAELATRCAATKFDQIDAALGSALAALGEAFAVDRCVAYLPTAHDTSSFRGVWRWCRPGCELPSDDFDAISGLPGLLAAVRAGESVCARTLDDLPHDTDRESMQALGAASCAAVPLGTNGSRGALVVDTSTERGWPREVVDSLHLVAAVMGQAVARKYERERNDVGMSELTRQRQQTMAENAVLRREMNVSQPDRTIASDSVAIRRVLAQVQQVAPTSATVLLLGETGAGKEVFAQAIHNLSPRQRRAMIRVSCAAIPVALIESELFGRERGAFTGALSRQIGRFEAANGSTIFLDEIGDLPLEIQVKLLRVLQERTVERLGGNQSMKVDVRVIAATNRDLEQAVANNTFREDLFYRLNVFPITIPPLRERIDDIPSLVWTFVDEFSRAFGKKIDSISKESIAALQRYSWPGNVRELRNVIEREMIVATGPTLVISPPRPVSTQRRAASSRLVDIEVEHITSVLESCRWRVRGAGGAAERLGVKPTTLESRMARLGISRDKQKSAQA